MYYPVGLIYFSVANLDPAMRSQLGAIHLAIVFNTLLLDKYSIDAILNPFIHDLDQLHKVCNWYGSRK